MRTTKTQLRTMLKMNTIDNVMMNFNKRVNMSKIMRRIKIMGKVSLIIDTILMSHQIIDMIDIIYLI
jgi:hypothetical protein